MKRVAVAIAALAACPAPSTPPPPRPAEPPAAAPVDKPVAAAVVADAKAKLVAKHGEAQRARIERGVDQVASLWRTGDGDLVAFCLEQYVPDDAGRDALFARLEA